MLTQLNIHNFRLFKQIEIEGLRQINLFAGKNNSGKTALLEALRIMEAGEDLSVMEYILQQRGQQTMQYWDAYDALFYRPELQSAPDGEASTIVINDFNLQRIKQDSSHSNYSIHSRGKNRLNINHLRANQPLPQPLFPRDAAVFIPFGANDYFPLERLWESIVLTPKEDQVTQILRECILPTLVRLDVKPDRTLVRLNGEDKPLPLKSLGDGAQRMLIIAVALVSAKDKLLLLDEIEAGLHYSVLEKLWEIIFRYAAQFNVQVFATTHSSDAIKAFTYTLEKPENHDQGAFFRLQANRQTGQIEAIAYGIEELNLSLEANLEPR